MTKHYQQRDARYNRSRQYNGRRGRYVPSVMHRPVKRPAFSTFVLRLLLASAVVVALMLFVGIASAFTAYNQLAQSLKPRLEAVAEHDSFETTRIYDRNNVLLYEFVDAGQRTQISLEDVSSVLISATVAIEDQTFFENRGVDYMGIAKALFRSLRAGEETGGASTITQQLVRGVILTNEELAHENRYQRKVVEILLAEELTRQYSKEEILELYLNEIYYGNMAYGIEAASDVYFGIPAKELNLAQASLLAGLPQLPSLYDPINHLEGGKLPGIRFEDGWLSNDYELPAGTSAPKRRQAAVLTQMVRQGIITDQEARAAAAQDLVFADQIVPLNAPHFVFYVRKLLEENPNFGQQFASQGLSIYTTLDLELQNMAQTKAKERILELEERNIHNAAVVVMQPNSGEILAMVGSIDYNSTKATTTEGQVGNVLDGQVNVATRERQPGSALKPFTFAAAMEQGMTPGTVLWDVPTEFPPFGPNSYKPENYNGRWNGPLRMRTALANSLNMPAVKALKYAGIDNTIDLLHRVGIKGLNNGSDYYGLALTLGGGEVTPLDLTTAYNTLASRGRYFAPVAIKKITNSQGDVLFEQQKTNGVPVLSEDIAMIISDMLSDDQARRPIWGLNSRLKLTRPAAVKTGTTNDWRDAWAVGYTPYVTVGVWTGNNNNEETAKVESINGGGAIWHDVMEEMFADPHFSALLAEPYDGELPINFEMPETVVQREICQLPGPFNGHKTELFSISMLEASAESGQGGGGSRRGMIDGCNAFETVTVVRLSDRPVSDNDENSDGNDEFGARGNYCLPVEGLNIPADMYTTIRVWNLPPVDPAEEKVEFRWEGSGLISGKIPQCSLETIATVAPPGAIRMPDLRHFGENQAKEMLASLGLTNIYVDYQDRSRIPDSFDSFAPYAVVSSMPAAGEWVYPEQLIVLGIRTPDANPATPENPSQPTPAQAPSSDPAQPPADPVQPPADPGQPVEPAPPPAEPAPPPAEPGLPIEPIITQ